MGLTAESKRQHLPSADRIVTAEELGEHPEWGRCELLRGRVNLLSPSKGRHGAIAGIVHGYLSMHVIPRNLGVVLAAETGILIQTDPDTVRAPDVAFIRKDRLPGGKVPDEFLRIAPDLAVEVVSPTDRFKDVIEKAKQYLAAGVKAVWIFEPKDKTVHVLCHDGTVTVWHETDTLRDEEILPGFALDLKDVFKFI